MKVHSTIPCILVQCEAERNLCGFRTTKLNEVDCLGVSTWMRKRYALSWNDFALFMLQFWARGTILKINQLHQGCCCCCCCLILFLLVRCQSSGSHTRDRTQFVINQNDMEWFREKCGFSCLCLCWCRFNCSINPIVISGSGCSWILMRDRFVNRVLNAFGQRLQSACSHSISLCCLPSKSPIPAASTRPSTSYTIQLFDLIFATSASQHSF